MIELCEPGMDPYQLHQLLQRLANHSNTPIAQLNPAALTEIQKYNFPGNIRKLENILERALTLCKTNTIQQPDLHLPTTNTDAGTIHALPLQSSLENYLADIEKTIILNTLEAN